MNLHINFLNIHTKNIKQLTNELLHLQDIAEVTADLDQAEELMQALEELKTVVANLPLA